MRTILMAAVLLSGCAITFQDKPSRGPAKSASCSTSLLWVADAVGLAAATAALAASIVKADDWNDGGTVVGGVGAMGVVFYSGSMSEGISRNRECGRQQRETTVARGE